MRNEKKGVRYRIRTSVQRSCGGGLGVTRVLACLLRSRDWADIPYAVTEQVCEGVRRIESIGLLSWYVLSVETTVGDLLLGLAQLSVNPRVPAKSMMWNKQPPTAH